MATSSAGRSPLASAPDVNGDGKPDVKNILDRVDQLHKDGVIFDESAPMGHIPVRGRKGRYPMVCIDLIYVAYRAAGYDLLSAMTGGPLFKKDAPPPRGAGGLRLVTRLLAFVKKSPHFHYYDGPDLNLAAHPKWRPRTPFRVGDMLLIHYDDNADRHSGIVTGVDPNTGLPTYITQVSIYTATEGMHRSTLDEFFSVVDRRLTGWARPALWDQAPMSAEERALTVPLPPEPPRPTFYPGGAFEDIHARARARLASGRAARLGERSPAAPGSPTGPAPGRGATP
ncbi:MAG: hypothetical protein HY815_33805 [Candidatus Riflebacteria bacterium]|nr:hypothetical protein [Candidatus Riflebacteria bacterium]